MCTALAGAVSNQQELWVGLVRGVAPLGLVQECLRAPTNLSLGSLEHTRTVPEQRPRQDVAGAPPVHHQATTICSISAAAARPRPDYSTCLLRPAASSPAAEAVTRKSCTW